MSTAESRPRRGRRSGNPDTRGTILASAQVLFTSQGFDGTSMRGVAREAGVDPALVHHYFGDKVGLLLATAEITLDPRRLLERVTTGETRTVGWRMVSTALATWESPIGATLVQVVRQQPALLQAFVGVISHHLAGAVIGPRGLSRDAAEERLAMVETIMGGILMTRFVARMEPMASLPPRQVVRLFGPLVQQVLEQGPAGSAAPSQRLTK